MLSFWDVAPRGLLRWTSSTDRASWATLQPCEALKTSLQAAGLAFKGGQGGARGVRNAHVSTPYQLPSSANTRPAADFQGMSVLRHGPLREERKKSSAANRPFEIFRFSTAVRLTGTVSSTGLWDMHPKLLIVRRLWDDRGGSPQVRSLLNPLALANSQLRIPRLG